MKKTNRYLFLFLMTAIFAAIEMAQVVSAQDYSKVTYCYNESKVVRTIENSNPADFCFDDYGNVTQITFSQFQQYRLTLNKAKSTQTPIPVKKPTEIPSPVAPNKEAASPTEVPNKIEIVAEEAPAVSASPVAEVVTEAPAAAPVDSVTTVEPVKQDETVVSEKETQLEITTESTAAPEKEKGSIFDPIKNLLFPKKEEPTMAAPIEDLRADPSSEKPDENSIATEEVPTKESPVATEETQPVPEITPEVSEDAPAMLMRVPVIGTITSLSGDYPSAGAIVEMENVTFSWSFDSEGINTSPTEFILTVDGNSAKVDASCGVDSCQAMRKLAAGNHSWYVTALISTKKVSSPPINFSIVLPAAAPGKPLNLQPVAEQTTRVVTLNWTPSERTESYSVKWAISATLKGEASISATDASCISGTCSATISFPSEGTVSWMVTAINKNGQTNSDSVAFVIKKPIAAPAKPTIQFPENNVEYATRNVNFVWNQADDAKSYIVNWKNEFGNTGSRTIAATDASCMTGSCRLEETLPAEGKYTWSVTSVNEIGQTKSDVIAFSIKTNITTPDGYAPQGTLSYNKRITFSFADVKDNVFEYNVRVVDQKNNVVLDRYWNINDVRCEKGRCYASTDVILPSGKLTWRVRGRSNNSISNWSAPLDFYPVCSNCSNPNPNPPVAPAHNTVPTPLYPVGMIQTAVPAFSWKPITGANAYWVKLFDASGKVIYQGSSSNSICDWSQCTLNAGFTLPGNGNYSWHVSGGANTGVVWNVATATFTLNSAVVQPSQPKEVKFVTPIQWISPAYDGDVYEKEAQVLWVDQSDAIQGYEVKILDRTNQVLLTTSLKREDAWCDGKKCTLDFSQIAVGEKYLLELTVILKDGTKGETAPLRFNVTDQKQELKAIYPMLDSKTKEQRPVFSWSLPSETSKEDQKKYTYYVKLVNTTTSQEAIMGPFHCETDELTCFNQGAFFIPAEDLPKGEYVWGVQVTELQKATEPIKFVIE